MDLSAKLDMKDIKPGESVEDFLMREYMLWPERMRKQAEVIAKDKWEFLMLHRKSNLTPWDEAPEWQKRGFLREGLSAIKALHGAGMIEDGNQAFAHGYVIACCNLINLHDQPGMAHDVLLELGLTKAQLKAMDLTDYDMNAFNEAESDRQGSVFTDA